MCRAKCPAHSDGYHGSVQVAIRTEERPSKGGEHFHLSIQGEGYATGNVEQTGFSDLVVVKELFFCKTAWRRYLEMILYAVICVVILR